MTCGDFKDLPRRTVFDKILRDKAFNIAENAKYDGYQKVLLQWFINCFIKSLQVVVLKIKNLSDLQLADDLHKPIIKKV